MMKLAIEIGNKNIEIDALNLLLSILDKKKVKYEFLGIDQDTDESVRWKLKQLKKRKDVADDNEVYKFNRRRNASIIKFLSSGVKKGEDVNGECFISFNKPFLDYISNANTISKHGNNLEDIMESFSEFIIYLSRLRDELYGKDNYNQYITFDMSFRLLMQKYMKYTGRKLSKNEFNPSLDTIVATYAFVDKDLKRESYIIVSGFNVKTKNHRRFKISDMKKSFEEVFGKDHG